MRESMSYKMRAYLHPPNYGYQDAELQDASWVLLDLTPYIADRENSTSACAAMSNGETIRVTLCTAPTPLVSYICVWCPGLTTTEMLAMYPSIEAAESDLLLLRVTVSRNKAGFFVYKANGGPNGVPSLRPIQIPGSCLAYRYTVALLGHRDITPLPSHGEDDVAADPGLVSLRPHGGGAGGIPYLDGEVVRFRPRVDDAGHYYVAAINIDSCSRQGTQFSFCLFNSSKGEKWSTTQFSLGGDLPLHITNKSIALRQDGLLGFVDLLRGIIICDVLSPETQRYLPLPPEAIRREDYSSDPLLFRDVAIVGGRLTLVELLYIVPPGSNLSPRWTWEISSWSRLVNPDLEQNWRLDYKVQSCDITVDMNTDNLSLLPMVKDSEGVLMPSLERLYTALPVLSLSNKGVVYIMGKVGRADDKALVLSVNMIKQKLEGVAMFDAERMVDVYFSYTCTQSRIPEYLNPGLKRRPKRPGMFPVGYPHKLSNRIDEDYGDFYAEMQLSAPAQDQQDTGASKGVVELKPEQASELELSGGAEEQHDTGEEAGHQDDTMDLY